MCALVRWPELTSRAHKMAASLIQNGDLMRSDKVRSLCTWWQRNCANEIPDRTDLDPTDLKHLLPNLFIADVEHEPFRIRYRLVGTKATEATGVDITGLYLDDLLPADGSEPWMEFYRQSYMTRVPVLGESLSPTTSGASFRYEFGLFPLRNGGYAVSQFVAIEDYFDLTSALSELVHWREKRLRHWGAYPAISLWHRDLPTDLR
jgi:hypothetical protein